MLFQINQVNLSSGINATIQKQQSQSQLQQQPKQSLQQQQQQKELLPIMISNNAENYVFKFVVENIKEDKLI